LLDATRLGLEEGALLGDLEGLELGPIEGIGVDGVPDGALELRKVGTGEGLRLGLEEGALLGDLEGLELGPIDGIGADGVLDGALELRKVGTGEGLAVVGRADIGAAVPLFLLRCHLGLGRHRPVSFFVPLPFFL
jgi:hypothetical protein